MVAMSSFLVGMDVSRRTAASSKKVPSMHPAAALTPACETRTLANA